MEINLKNNKDFIKRQTVKAVIEKVEHRVTLIVGCLTLTICVLCES